MNATESGAIENPASRHPGLAKLAIFAAKLIVTGTCFWYLSRKIDPSEVWQAVSRMDFRWEAIAILLFLAQIPLLAIRWRTILKAIDAFNDRTTRGAVLASTAIGIFFAQVLPTVASEGVRAWLLVQLKVEWRKALVSVLIDRAVGVGLLIAMGLVILLLPSGVTALGRYRGPVLLTFGALLAAGALTVGLTPVVAPLLRRWRYSGWIAAVMTDTHRALLGPKSPEIIALGSIVHLMTVMAIWSLGRAQGFPLALADAAVLFIAMVGVGLIPISVSGWGLRELAVISLLGNYSIAPERSLLLSVCYGLAVAVSALPGALLWLNVALMPARQRQH